MKTIELFKVKCDVYGNPRVVVHFINLLKDEELKGGLAEAYKIAHKRANALGGKVYRGRDFGGGFVFQSYNNQDLINNIEKSINEK